ncbi:MAG TPA: hypothetical protein VF460_01295 [Burkholderiales bacterium]
MADSPSPQHTPIMGNADYAAALDAILEKPRKTVRIFENALGRDYNSPKRVESLRTFLLGNPRNRLRIVVHDMQSMDRNCPRLLNLLRVHAHSISIHETHQTAKAVYDPFVIVDDLHYVHRFHFEELRGLLALDDPIGTHTLIERFEEIWEASSPAVSATTLGL